MAVKARLKFDGMLPFTFEHKLCTKYGFRVLSRHGVEWVIFEKQAKPKKFELLVNGELPEDVQNELNARCDRICNMFRDPEAHLPVIRTRLHNVKATLPPLQQNFIDDWIERNLKEDQ